VSGRRWTDAEDAIVRAQYANSRTGAIADALGRTVGSVHQRARVLGLFKSATFIAETSRVVMARPDHPARKTAFSKGQAPWNKGVPQSTGYSSTRFKPGQLSGRAAQLARPVGEYRIAAGYLEQKFSAQTGRQRDRWMPVHRLVWEAKHGPTPEGCVVVFKTGCHSTELQSITEDAVECITRVELMKRNSYLRYGPEIAGAIRLRGAINRQINKRAKHEQDHQ
jgi:hypothetical protein